MRVAMWSGPRNLSTALMYSFGNRADMTAVDEPFYGAWLLASGAMHPMREEVIASMRTDAVAVAEALREYRTPHQYEKHMVHHMAPDFPLEWLAEVCNVFLLRHPARVLASYLQKRESPTAEELGFGQQGRLFRRMKEAGIVPVVIDSARIRARPEAALRALCEAVGLPFDAAMLNWPAGPKAFDGVWAAHWYDAVHRSGGFAPEERALPTVPREYRPMLEKALVQYEELAGHALVV